MSNLVVKIKHHTDLTDALKKAVLVANYAIKNRMKLSTANVKDIGLPSAISNQILRKYGRNKKCKKINPNKIKLVAPGRDIKVDGNKIRIVPLKLTITNESKYTITKVNQIELDATYAYVCFEQPDQPQKQVENWIGVDLNATSHCAVAADPVSGKVLKLGKQAPHVHKKYQKLRASLQSAGLYKKLKQTKGREARIIRDLNHKISKQIVEFAKQNNAGIKLEKLTGIRKNKKNNRASRTTLNSWSYYQLGQMIYYKATLAGLPVQYISPAYTSQECSQCGCLGQRDGKKFVCEHCNHRDHADANAAFNIGKSSNVITSKQTEMLGNGDTDAPMRQRSAFREQANSTSELPTI